MNQKCVREFLGMVGYYRKFINRFTYATRPMTKLIRKGVKFEWTDECHIGFDYLMTCLTEAPVLKYLDPSKRYVVFTDASDEAAVAILIQDILVMMERPRICQLPTFQHSKGMQSTMQSKSGDITLRMQRYS